MRIRSCLNETLVPVLGRGTIRKKLGLTQQKFAKKLGMWRPSKGWERDETPADPVLQALRISTASPNPPCAPSMRRRGKVG